MLLTEKAVIAAAGGGQVDNDVHARLFGGLLDRLKGGAEILGLHSGTALLVVDVDMDHRGPSLGHRHSVGGDLLGCDGHIGRLGFHGARPAECRGDDEFFGHSNSS